MDIFFTEKGWESFTYWIDHDPTMVKKIKDLLKSIRQDPFKGLGRPEPLKHGLKGYWSRRITHEHRLVYKISVKRGVNPKCSIISCRFHY